MKKYITNTEQVGKIYIIATPIGNIEDITMRALKIMKAVDVIACEDTRITQKLLNYYDIKTKKTIYQKHNEITKSKQLVDFAKAGLIIGIVSDAGMPGIADPGNIIIKMCHENNVPVEIIPGATSSITAYIGSGIDSPQFTFYGFLNDKKNIREKELLNILAHKYPTIIFVSPHKIIKILEEIKSINCNQEIVIARELTKIHEEYIEGKVFDILNQIEEIVLKGEIVLIIKPSNPKIIKINEIPKLDQEILSLLKKNSTKEASKIIADKYELKKNIVYEHILKINKNS